MKKLTYLLPCLLFTAAVACTESDIDDQIVEGPNEEQTDPDKEPDKDPDKDPDKEPDKDPDKDPDKEPDVKPKPDITPSPKGNLVFDYGFDYELGAEKGWKADKAPQSISIADESDSLNSFGNRALRLTVDTPTRPQAIANTFEAKRGSIYTVSFSGVLYPEDDAEAFVTLNIVQGAAGANIVTASGNQRIYAADVATADEGKIIDRTFTIAVPRTATYTTITPRVVLTAGTTYIDKVSVIESGIVPLEISSFKIEPVEIEDDVHYQKLAVAHNGDKATTSIKYDITEGDGEIKLYSITGSEEFYYYAPTASTKSAVIKVTVTDTKSGDLTTASCTYQAPVFDYDNYYLVKSKWEEVNNPTNAAAYAFHENNPDLPNVLLIGTSISVGYTNPVWSGMAGVANVYRIPENSLNTPYGLQKLDFWLNGLDGSTFQWDVIHFNFGHHDLKQSNSGYAVPIEDYKKNLPLVFDKILARGKKVIWANTTYCNQCGNKGGGTLRVPADIVKYNAAAAEILAQDKYSSIIVDDQYTLTEANKQWLNGVHFTSAGYAAIAKQVCAALKLALGAEAGGDPVEPSYKVDSTELLVDTTFDKELGAGGWKAVQVVGDISIVGSDDSKNLFGNRALRMTLSSAAKNTQTVANAIAVTPGTSYLVKYSAVYYPEDNAFVNGKGGKFLTLNIAQGVQTGISGGNLAVVSSGSQRLYDTDDDYKVGIIEREFVMTIPANAAYTSVTPKFVLTAGTAYIDNVSILKIIEE